MSSFFPTRIPLRRFSCPPPPSMCGGTTRTGRHQSTRRCLCPQGDPRVLAALQIEVARLQRQLADLVASPQVRGRQDGAVTFSGNREHTQKKTMQGFLLGKITTRLLLSTTPPPQEHPPATCDLASSLFANLRPPVVP